MHDSGHADVWAEVVYLEMVPPVFNFKEKLSQAYRHLLERSGKPETPAVASLRPAFRMQPGGSASKCRSTGSYAAGLEV